MTQGSSKESIFRKEGQIQIIRSRLALRSPSCPPVCDSPMQNFAGSGKTYDEPVITCISKPINQKCKRWRTAACLADSKGNDIPSCYLPFKSSLEVKKYYYYIYSKVITFFLCSFFSFSFLHLNLLMIELISSHRLTGNFKQLIV